MKINKNCPYYPCSFDEQICNFCFCPFYPCREKATGGKWFETPQGFFVWDCTDCKLIHREEVVKKLILLGISNSKAEVDKLNKGWNIILQCSRIEK